MTNFDKLKFDIQNMSAEEFVNKFIDVDNCTSCSMCLKEWLNQEAE